MNTLSTDTPDRSFGSTAARALALACAGMALVAGSAQAQSHGSRGGGHGGHGYHGGHGDHGGGHHAPRHGYRRGGNGWVWGGVGLGLGLGLGSYYASPRHGYYGYSEPNYVVVNPPIVYEAPRSIYSQPIYGQPVDSRPVPVRSLQPVIYPRNGQSAAVMDSDANACSEWAGQQPNATSDRGVFMRGTQACMDARGYTVR